MSVSLPLLLLVIWLDGLEIKSFVLINFILINSSWVNIVFIAGLSLAFLVKLPAFITHLWLPKAHVEAPVAGSMILAGVLLKLGGYGLFRVLSSLTIPSPVVVGFLFGLSLLGIFYVGLMCCRLNDLKALVAYSSVAHMAMVICGVIRFYVWGFNGSLLIIISHGLASSGLFCIVNMYYERLGSRSFYINRGLLLILPLFCLMLFMLSAANIAAPPTINLASEIFLIIRILSYDEFIILVFPVGSFLGAVFTLFMFSYSQHGSVYYASHSHSLINVRELHALASHVIPVNFLILKGDFYLILF